MTASVLLDTHVWAWSLIETDQISDAARDLIESADTVCLSPISFFEIAQKVRLGKWERMSKVVGRMSSIAEDQGLTMANTVPAICEQAGSLVWDHRDPFDRILAATALHHDLHLVTRDRALHNFNDITCIW